MPKPIEASVYIDAAPAAVFAVYEDVSSWSVWDPDTQHAEIDGPFDVGTSGRLVPAKGAGINMRITEMIPHERFTVVGGIPLFKMTFVHELRPEQGGTRATHRASFSGALAFLFGTLVRSQLSAGLPITMASLKHYVEDKSH